MYKKYIKMGSIISKLCPWFFVKKNPVDSPIQEEGIPITDRTVYNEDVDRAYKMIGTNDHITDLEEVQISLSNLIIERQCSIYEMYEFQEELGSGTYGSVWKVKHKLTEKIRAVKIITKEFLLEGVDCSQIEQEISVLKLLDHPNILKFYEFFQDESKFYLVTEYCDHGDLHDKVEKMKRMDEIIVKALMYQLLVAVAYLHSKNVIHGDLKLENILIDKINLTHRSSFKTSITIDIEEIQRRGLSKGHRSRSKTVGAPTKAEYLLSNISNFDIKLIDFGCSRIFNRRSNKRLSGIIGTDIYCSPEVIDNKFNEKCDIWSCGIIMYILLAGYPPFVGDTTEEVFENIKKYKVSFDYPEFEEVSDEAKNLIMKLLAFRPGKRISAVEALNHSFFSENLESFKSNEIKKEDIDLTVLSNIKNYGNNLKFQQAILAYLTHNFANKEEVQKIRKVFKYLDKNSDGIISKEELLLGFKECEQELTEESLDNIIKAIDNDCNGFIEYEEFIRAAIDKSKLLTETNLRLAYDLFDKDKKGEISCNEVKNIIFQNQNIPDQIISNFLAQIEKKEDDLITFDEFKVLMLQLKN